MPFAGRRREKQVRSFFLDAGFLMLAIARIRSLATFQIDNAQTIVTLDDPQHEVFDFEASFILCTKGVLPHCDG